MTKAEAYTINKDILKKINLLEEEINKIKEKPKKRSTSQQRADKKYKDSLYPHNLRFTKYEQELIQHLDKQENKTHYLKNLIAKDLGYKSYSEFITFLDSDYISEKRKKDFCLKLEKEGY